MELFKLLGTIAIDNKGANEAIDATGEKTSGLGEKLVKGVTTAAKWGAALTTAAIGAGTALTALATKAASTGDNIDKMSQKIGISREAYQELDFICSQSGTSVDLLQMGIKTLTNQMQSASDGTKTASEMFKKLNVSIYDSNGQLKDQESMMWEVMIALQNMENQTEKAALATDLFGRSGSELMPLLNGASGSIESMKQQAHDLGLVLSDEFVDDSVKFTDTMDQMKRALTSAGTKIASVFLPYIQKLASKFVDFAPKIQEFAGVIENKLIGAINTVRQNVVPFINSLRDSFSKLWEKIKPSESLVEDLTLVFGRALPNQFRHFKESVEENFGGIGEKIRDVFWSIYDIVKMFSESYLSQLLWNFTALIEFVYDVCVPAFSFLMNAFSDLSGIILEKASPALEKINDAFNTVAYIVREAVTDYITPTLSQFIEMIQNLWVENQDKITKIGELISIIADRISEKVAWLVGIIENYVYPFFIWLVGIVQNNMVYIQEWIQAILDVIGAIIDVFINLFQGNWSQMWLSIQEVMHLAGEALKKSFKALIQIVKDLLLGWIQFILDKVFGLQVDLEQKFTEIKDNIVEKWNNIKDSVSEAVTNLKENVSQTFTDLKEALKVPINGIIGMVNKVIDALNSLSWNFPDWIPGFGGKSFSFNLKRVEYLAEGGILTSPTLLQYNPYAGTATIAGEAGAEAVIPIEKLRVWIAEEMAAQNYGVVKVLQSILDAILAMDENMGGNLRNALAGTAFKMNNREFGRLVKAVN